MDGNSSLHTAVLSENLYQIRSLIQSGTININSTNNRGETPLHLAIKKVNTQICISLLNANANIDAKDNDAWTPNHLLHNLYHNPEITHYLQNLNNTEDTLSPIINTINLKKGILSTKRSLKKIGRKSSFIKTPNDSNNTSPAVPHRIIDRNSPNDSSVSIRSIRTNSPAVPKRRIRKNDSSGNFLHKIIQNCGKNSKDQSKSITMIEWILDNMESDKSKKELMKRKNYLKFTPCEMAAFRGLDDVRSFLLAKGALERTNRIFGDLSSTESCPSSPRN